jgi:predicted dehydrogenase
MSRITRRDFLGRSGRASAAAAAALAVGFEAPSRLFGGGPPRRPAPSDRIRLGVIGAGGQGKADLGAFLKLDEIDVPAVAEVDARRLGEGLKMVADARGRAPEGYGDFRRILERPDIDAVLVATPDHWHALATILACQAGKDVYVEKPLATTIAEGRAMTAWARRTSRIVQVGTQQRSSSHFKDAVAFVRSGQLGRIRSVRAWAFLDWKGDIGRPPDAAPPPELDYEMWLGPAPQRPYNPMRVHHNFRWCWDYSGGLQTDWGAHMIDVVLWAMGQEPLAAMSAGGKFGFPDDIRETPDTQQSIIEFPGFTLLWEHMIGCGMGPWQREHGCEFHGSNGLLVVDRGGWEVVSETDRFKQPERVKRMADKPRVQGQGDFHLEHIRDFAACVRSRRTPVGDVEIGHKSITVPHLANIAYRTRRRVAWDAAAERIVGDEEAQALTGRAYRAPWTLPQE